jgi:hypothetical protein
MDTGPTSLSVREPALYQYVYSLRTAGGDDAAATTVRQQVFVGQLRAAVEHLCSILGREPPSVALSEPDRVGRHQQVQIYPAPGKGPLFLTDETRYLWLWAFAIHDTYLIRVIYAATGEYPVEMLTQMAAEWLWQASSDSDLLGHTVYHAAIVPPGTSKAFAQAVLAARMGQEEVELVSAQTRAGPLFATWSGGEVYALAYPDAAAETRANRLFDVVIPELAWYWHKVRAQGALYRESLYPALHAAEDAVSVAIETVLHQGSLGGGTGRRLNRLQTQLHLLSDAYVNLSRLIGQAEMMGQTMAINATNYRETLPRLLAEAEEAETVTAAWLRVGLRDQAQIEADLIYQRLTLERAETVLDTIRSRVDLLRGEIDRRTNLIFGLIGIGVAFLEIVGLEDETLLLRLGLVIATLGILYGLWWLWQKRRAR